MEIPEQMQNDPVMTVAAPGNEPMMGFNCVTLRNTGYAIEFLGLVFRICNPQFRLWNTSEIRDEEKITA